MEAKNFKVNYRKWFVIHWAVCSLLLASLIVVDILLPDEFSFLIVITFFSMLLSWGVSFFLLLKRKERSKKEAKEIFERLKEGSNGTDTDFTNRPRLI